MQEKNANKKIESDLNSTHTMSITMVLSVLLVGLVFTVFGLRVWFDSVLHTQLAQKTQLSAASELAVYQQEVQQVLSGKTILPSQKKGLPINEAIGLFVKQQNTGKTR